MGNVISLGEKYTPKKPPPGNVISLGEKYTPKKPPPVVKLSPKTFDPELG
jgi:hypothetical protein